MLTSVDIKPDNVLVNYKPRYGENDSRFSDIQLADLGGTYPADSHWARSGTPVGAPMWRSPEMIMETPWNTATDIWSFGAVVSHSNYRSVDILVLEGWTDRSHSLYRLSMEETSIYLITEWVHSTMKSTASKS